MKLALLSIFLALPLAAQTAKVVSLSPQDTAKAIRLRADLKAAQEAVEKFDLDVKDRYVSDLKDEQKDTCSSGNLTLHATTLCLSSYGCAEPTSEEKRKAQDALDAYRVRCYKAVKVAYPRDGWSGGFTYSEDFKYIVPSEPGPPTLSNANYGLGCLGTGVFTTADDHTIYAAPMSTHSIQ